MVTSWEVWRASCWWCRSTRTGTTGFRSLQASHYWGEFLGLSFSRVRDYMSPLWSHDNCWNSWNIIGLDVGIVCCCLDICITIMKEPGLFPETGLWLRTGKGTLYRESYGVSCNKQALHQESLFFEFVLTIQYYVRYNDTRVIKYDKSNDGILQGSLCLRWWIHSYILPTKTWIRFRSVFSTIYVQHTTDMKPLWFTFSIIILC